MIKRSTGIQDAGVPLKVDHFTRKVTVPVTERVIGVVGDHCSEQVTFSLARNIDNHDMTTCTSSYVAWRNVDGGEGTDDLVITEATEDQILFGWTVRDAITVAKGLVSFSLHFECWDAGKLVYKWGTHTCTECEILDAINTKMGAYAAIYIDGETLVFSDYTPVREETLELSSGIIPEGTLEITEAGKHDVGRYAYVDVKAVYETPGITIANGKVTAEANGLTAEEELETPSISVADGKVTAEANGLTAEKGLERPTIEVTSTGYIEARANGLKKTIPNSDVLKFTQVRLYHPNGGLVMSTEGLQVNGSLAFNTLDLSKRVVDVTLLYPIAGSVMRFVSKNNTAPTVTVVGHPSAVEGTAALSGGTVSCTQIIVPVVEAGTIVEINMV